MLFNKHVMIVLWGYAALAGVTDFSMAQDVKATQDLRGTPAGLYGPLFVAVQQQRLFPDSKTFADAVAVAPVQDIMAAYKREVQLSGFDLKDFVIRYFRLEKVSSSDYQSGGEDICTHIRNLWPVLTRQSYEADVLSSLLPLKYPYIVPGGRFREIYYWDSYFTMLGLNYSGNAGLIRSMMQNFADLIERYGYVPNGNRSYYLSRSQPPFFALMVDLLAQEEGNQVYTAFLPALRQEYAFWMDGAELVWPGQSYRRVVKMSDGSVLNRYYDDGAMPRDEAWYEDMTTAELSGRNISEVFKNLRAAAESGWDFSSRWLKNPQDLSTIRTLDIIPVDLNSLLYHLEQVLEKASDLAGNSEDAELFAAKAAARKQAINDYLWNDARGFFADYIVTERRISDDLTAASFYPLFTALAGLEQAQRVAVTAQKQLLKSGGLLTTTIQIGQQWDEPNVWAPLQWIAVKGLENYNEGALALEIAHNWTNSVAENYSRTGALKEKYHAYVAGINAGGGEYPGQDGFGWTNGVLLSMFQMFPQLPAAAACRR